MEHEQREFSTSPVPPITTNDEINKSSRMARYERPPSAVESTNHPSAEEKLRLLFEKDVDDAHKKGFWVCRLWQLLLTLNVTIILTTIVLILLLLFIIGPLSPYQTFGQSCRALSCNPAYGLECSTGSICLCPSTNSYWSYNETGCRRCPDEWTMINGKCVFVSTFNLDWADAFAYCKSFTAQLLTFSSTKMYSSLTLSQINNLVVSNTNYFIGLTEQPNDSGKWQWVDGSSLSTTNLFCVNGSINSFDTIFRTNMNCGIYRMDSCLARYTCQRADINFICQKMNSELPDIKKFLRDESKDNLVVYELEFNKIDDPNEKFCAEAKSQGQCPCRLWLILLLVNLAVLIIVIFLILLLLIEIGPVPPYQTYGQQCVSAKCDSTKGLICTGNSKSKTCQCPSGNWFWYNNTKCRECPPNWIISNNNTGCYFVSYIRLSFIDASSWCMNSQSRLIEILNDKIFATLQLIKNFSFNLNGFYWIGLREIGPNKNIYRWISSDITFTNTNYFCSGQPDHTYNYYFQEYDQCIGLYIQSNSSSCLADSTCSNVAPFICELY